jgi:DNA primase
MLSAQWLDELRARVTLSSVVMRTTKLQRAGREWKACCPFHNEKSPSFTVSDEKGFYHCFGCGAHGDVIRWMTDQRGLAFMDAVKELAAEAGMDVPAPDPRAARQAEQRASLHDVCQAAQDWFASNLKGERGGKARDYLASRGFNARTVERFGFGYAPADRQAMKAALAQFDEAMLIEAGLRITVDPSASSGQAKEPYDRFRDRLMLPIHDVRGRVIGFGGRILEADTKAPKYLNSPDTPLFDKGRTLYNLHRAGPASRQTRRLIVVEGYMDVIALAAAGIEDTVAPMGTALTERQLELLWRLVETPVLCFDGDAAGQRAAMRAISRALPMLQPAHSLAIVRLPAGLDPDDLIKQQGAKAMEALLADPASLLDTLWSFERDAHPLRTPEDKAGLKARLLEHVEAIRHPDIAALYRRELLERFSAFAFPPRPPRPPRAEWKKGSFGKPATPALSPEAASRLRKASTGGARDALAAAVIAGLMRYPDQVRRHAEALSHFAERDPLAGPAIDSLLEAVELLEPGDNSPISAADAIAAPPDQTRFAFLGEGLDPQVARDELAEAVSLLVERPALEAALAAATARFETDPEGAFAEQQRLLKRKLDFEKRLGQVASNRAARAASSDSSEPAMMQPADEDTD